MKLRVSAITQSPLVYFTKTNNKTNIGGNMVQLLKILEKRANISHELVSPNESGWVGIIKSLAINESDFSLTPIVQSPVIEKALVFSKTIHFSSYIILSKLSETKDETDLIDHLSEVDTRAWIAWTICFMVLSLMSLFDKLMFSTRRQINYWTYIRITFNQYSTGDCLNSITGLISLYIFCYTSFVVSVNALINVSIVVVKNLNEINSLEDIVRTGNVVPSIYKTSLLEQVLENSEKDLHQKIWQMIGNRKDIGLRVIPSVVNQQTPGFNQLFFDSLIKGMVALFEPDYICHFIKSLYCRQVPDMRWHTSPPLDILTIRFSLGFGKALSPQVIDTLNRIIVHLTSGGIFYKWFTDDRAANKMLAGKAQPDCVMESSVQKAEYLPINVFNMKRLCRLISILTFCSILLLFLEIIFKLKNNKIIK